MELFPWRLLRPMSQTTMLDRAALLAPPNLSGFQQTQAFSGGGVWRTSLNDVPIHSEDRVMCARAWSVYLQGGAREIIVPMFDVGMAPWPQSTGAPSCVRDPQFFGQTADFGARQINASTQSSAPLRATSVQINIEPSVHSAGLHLHREDGSNLLREDGTAYLRENQGSALKGGEHFSIRHPIKGWRLYRITRITAVTGNVHTVDIQPPLREAVGAAEQIEFDVPRCVMRLDPAIDIEPPTHQTPRKPRLSYQFVEAL